jgi:hypothetical protein
MVHHTLKGCPHISDAQYLERLKGQCTVTESGCWDYNGFIHPSRGMEHRGPRWGYGSTFYRGKSIRTHKMAYICAHGPVPKGMCVMHKCDLPRCCNPEHLKIGTYAENSAEASAKGRSDRQWQTHCGRGHEFTPENIYHPPGRPNARSCKECSRMRQRGVKLQPVPRARRTA